MRACTVSAQQTYASDALLDLVDATARHQTRRLRHELVHIALAPVPVVHWHIAHIAHIAQSGQRRVQEQREQTAVLLEICQRRTNNMCNNGCDDMLLCFP